MATPTILTPAKEPERIGADLIGRYHRHIEHLGIVWLFSNKTAKSRGKTTGPRRARRHRTSATCRPAPPPKATPS